MSACYSPTKADDAKYESLVNQYESMGPADDPAFQDAIGILRKTSPTQLHSELMSCKRSGGRRRSRSRSRSRKSRAGGTDGEGEAPAPTPSQSSSKTMCYLRAMAKLSAMTAVVAGVAFNYVAPFLAEASGVKPCDGFMDQIVGYVGSYAWSSASCDVREEQYKMVVAGYTSLIVSVVGMTGLKMIIKSPMAFKLALRYLAARECPEKFGEYTPAQFSADMSRLKDAPLVSVGNWEKSRDESRAAAATAAAKAAADAAKAAASSQAAVEPAQGLADPNVEVGRRGRRGGLRRTRRAKSHRRRRASARRSHRRLSARRRSH